MDLVTSLLEDVVKDRRTAARGDTQERSGRLPVQELLSPWGWGVWVCLLRTLVTEILMDTSHVVSTNPSFSPSPRSREWGQGWKFQVSNHGLVFPVARSHPGAHLGPPR